MLGFERSLFVTSLQLDNYDIILILNWFIWFQWIDYLMLIIMISLKNGGYGFETKGSSIRKRKIARRNPWLAVIKRFSYFVRSGSLPIAWRYSRRYSTNVYVENIVQNWSDFVCIRKICLSAISLERMRQSFTAPLFWEILAQA